MDKKFSLMLFNALCPALCLHAADIDYTPLRLGGYNADVVLQPGEGVANTADGQWSFYSEALKGRGGLPQMVHGMFSDVPYQLADFSAPCAFKLSSSDIDAAEGTSYGSSVNVSLTVPQKARTLWLLATAPHGATKVDVIVHFSDGTSQEVKNVSIANWKATNNKGAAFWQLGVTDGTSPSSDCTYALYEAPVVLADNTREVTSLTVTLGEKGRSVCLFAVTATDKASTAVKDKKLFFISDSHLDTQWNWTVKSTIADYIKNTLNQTFERFEDKDDHNFTFNFEGAIKYIWAKEYYPSQYEKLKKYIADGRWNIAGGSIDASDVNIGSAESLIRNFLYGQSFYRKEFGVRGGRDIMLPDCFGFPWSLPTVAAHCGMKYFHTQKLSWNSAYAYNQLPRFARWIGTDGEEVLSVLKLCAYDEHEKFRKDMSADTDMLSEVNTNASTYGIPATIKYVGPRGDRGGGLDKETADWLSKSVDGSGSLGVTLNSATGMLDQLFHMGYDQLPTISHGLPMRAHGVGGYTSRTMLKYWMRKGELLGDAAEKASVAASWLGTLPYQHQTLTDAWVRLLWHQFHDDIPGTCINEAYTYTVNDQVLNQLDFSRTLNNAVGGVAKMMNTQWCENVPVVVYNPLSIERTDIVEGQVSLPDDVENIIVTDAQGKVVPSQITGREADGKLSFIFLGTVPSLGYATYNVAPSTAAASSTASTLSISEKGMENSRYKVTVNDNGDVSSILDKQNGNREMLSAPIRLAMLFDESLTWPSWEIHGDQLQKAPREYVDKEGLQVEVAENGPLRVSLKVTRTKNGSDFVQYIRLAADGCADRIDFVNEVNWQTRERMLKATFPLTVSNPKATYDLSIGADVNNNSTSYSTDSNNTTSLCEFLGHQWADVTNTSGDCGVSILNDCKYGWDKQKNNEIRLTLIHTPKVGTSYAYQGKQDLGLNRFTYSFFAHKGTWGADTQWEADKLNEPMLAYQTTRQDGALGTDFGFVKVDNKNVAVKALKKAEDSDKYIVRFYELTGQGQDVTAEFPADIVSAAEVNGVEELLGDAQVNGRKLTFHIDRFHPKTFQFELAAPNATAAATASEAPQSVPVTLSYNVDVMSSNSRRSDTDLDKSFPAELVGSQITADGIAFTMGSSANGKKNAVRCKGQTLTLPALAGARKVYVLASSLNEKGSQAVFGVGDRTVEQFVDYYGGMVGVWSNSLDVQKHYRMENTAFTATHSHSKTADNVYDYLYMYKYAFNLADGDNTLTLPNDPDLLVYAVTVSDNDNDDTQPLSEVVHVLNHKDTKDTYQAVVHDDEAITPASVRASGQTNSSESAEKASDGNADTKWCDNSSKVKWLEYKFSKPMTVTGWKVLNAGCEGDGKIASEYVLQRYVNGGWVDVQSVVDNSDNTTDFVLEHPFVSEGVRLRMVKGEQNGTIARVYELTVYGHEPKEGEAEQPQIISRIPTYGFGQQVATVINSSGRVNEKEDPYFMLDSSRGTKWCYNGSTAKPYAVFELSDAYMLSGFDIYDSQTHESYANSDEYEIAYSMDGKTYTTAVSEKGVSADKVHSCTLTEPVKAKYVKLTMAKTGGAVRVYQFDMWGVPATDADSQTDATATTVLSLHRPVIGAIKTSLFNESALNLFDGLKTKANKPFTWKIKKESASDVYAWAVVDLGAVCNVNQFVLYDAKSVGGVNNVSGYRIYLSNTRPTDSAMDNYSRTAGGTGWRRVANITGVATDNVKTFTPETTVSGRYVKLEIPFSCITDSAMVGQFEVHGQVASGIGQVNADSGIDIYPHVIEQGADLHLVAPATDASYRVTAFGGECVATGRFNGSTVLASTLLKKGVYMVTVDADRKRKTEKIVVK